MDLCPSQPLNPSKVPVGHIVANKKWKGSELVAVLQSSVKCIFEDNLDIVDFYASSQIAVIVVVEGELVAGGKLYGRKLVKLRKVNSVNGIVLAERTPSSDQYYSALQKFAVFELGLTLLPVATLIEAAQFLVEMVYVESNPARNLFAKQKVNTPFMDQSILLCLQSIPHLGEVKAKNLLDKFGSLQAICDASEEELSKVVGRSLANQVKTFFSKAISRIV